MTQEQSISVITALRGQSIRLPDLNAVFDGWPREVNQGLDRLRRDLDDWLDSAMSHHPKVDSLKAADYGYLGATLWPRASYERLRIVTFLAVWLFIWDDEIDVEDGSLWDNLELAKSYRTESREYVRYCLGLDSDPALEPISSVGATIQAFGTVGTAIRKAYNYEQRNRFMEHMELFMDMSCQEQMLQQQGTLPSLDDYWSYRLGTSAVPVIIALKEFAWDSKGLTRSVLESGDMKLLWNYTNIIVATINDIVSLKKEVAGGSIPSMIPLLYAQSRDAQVAVDQTVDFLAMNVKALDEVALRLLNPEKRHNIEQAREISEFVKQCQFYCTGSLTWSLSTPRYGIYNQDLSSGICVTL